MALVANVQPMIRNGQRVWASWAALRELSGLPWLKPLASRIASPSSFSSHSSKPSDQPPRLVPDLLPPAPKGFALQRRGTSQRTGMAAARHLRSGLPLLRAHLAASESAAVAQVPAPHPLSVVEADPFLSISIGLLSDLGLLCLLMS